MNMVRSPILGANPFKLGIFRMNCAGGLAITRAPERWRAEWDDIAAAARIADEAGLELILPLARWRGYGGSSDYAAWSYETLTHGAALAAITERIGIFVTVHVPLVHPLFAAKAVATIDHVSHGRVGLNIVCGWNKDEFDMFGVKLVDHDERYDQGYEWFDVFSRLVSGQRFDHAGRFYSLKDAYLLPTTVQQPRPITLSAGGSPKGRAFAAATADYFFAVVSDLEQARHLVAEVQRDAVATGGRASVFTISHVVCRDTQKEAEEYYDYFAGRMADDEAIDNWTGAKQRTSQSFPPDALAKRKRLAGGHSSYPLVGTPDRIADEILGLHRAGISGTTLSFLDFKEELPYFVAHVLPRLEQAGLLSPVSPAHKAKGSIGQAA